MEKASDKVLEPEPAPDLEADLKQARATIEALKRQLAQHEATNFAIMRLLRP